MTCREIDETKKRAERSVPVKQLSNVHIPKDVAPARGAFDPGRTPTKRNPWVIQALLILLSLTAGSTDTIGFLDLNGLFTAHVTGNLVVLAARLVQGGDAQLAKILAVPVFIVVLDMTILLADGCRAAGLAPIGPLLLLQFLLLVAFLMLCAISGPHVDADATSAVMAAMFGVSAMAVQNALVQISLKGAPSTAVMTTNITRFATDIGELVLGGSAADMAKASKRASRTLVVIAGFVVGCAMGAACEAALGFWSLALPACLAFIAFGIRFAVPSDAEVVS